MTEFAPSKIVAVGKNYRDHAAEFGSTAPEDEPMLFLKAPSALILQDERIVMPPESFTYGSVTPCAQWMSLRMRSRARRAFSWASNRRVWSTWAVSAETNECTSGVRTASITIMTTRSSINVKPLSARSAQARRRTASRAR